MKKGRYDLCVSCPFLRNYRRLALAIDRRSGPSDCRRACPNRSLSARRVTADYDRQIQLAGQARPVLTHEVTVIALARVLPVPFRRARRSRRRWKRGQCQRHVPFIRS